MLLRYISLRKALRTNLGLAATLLLLAGCGGQATETHTAPTLPVQGTIRFRGEPLTQGTITFAPDDIGREAQGTIGADGHYVMTTFKKDDGVIPGLHRVAIEGRTKAGAVPLKYRSAGGSGLQAEVAEGKSEYNFDFK